MNPLALHRGRPLRVLHGCYEIAGQGMMLARGLAENGCEAHSLAYRVDWDGRRPDFVVELDRRRGAAGKAAAMLGAFLRWGRHYDVYHFHFGTSFFGTPFFKGSRGSPLSRLRQIDLPLLRAMGKRIVFHFHGCEVRSRERMLAAHPLATCTECDPFCVPREQERTRALAAKHAGLVFYSTLDLGESVPRGIHLPLAIEAERWERAALDRPLPEPDRRDGVRGPVVIAHAPTHRLIKGTRHVQEAVERLHAEFPRVELRMIDRQPWAAMPEFLSGCDILVDQVMMGWYGLLAIEGMAERRTVVAYLREDLRSHYPDCPIVSAKPATLHAVLRDLVRDPARRLALGERGARFARERHDTKVVGERLLRHYRAMLGADAPGAAQGGAAAEPSRVSAA
ncbi:MAG TPA: hypothetical protein VGK89_05940 [Candidatus Eisenbacteria bacterium]|jgi:glycosyltransferase involved in cell wall biosynthesis